MRYRQILEKGELKQERGREREEERERGVEGRGEREIIVVPGTKTVQKVVHTQRHDSRNLAHAGHVT